MSDAPQAPAGPDVERIIGLRWPQPGGAVSWYAARFTYTKADPYAVKITFTSGELSIDYLLARSLLWIGLQTSVGVGPAKVEPAADIRCAPEPMVRITLTTPAGQVVPSTGAAGKVREFLQASFAVVPYGGEEPVQAAVLDAELSRLGVG